MCYMRLFRGITLKSMKSLTHCVILALTIFLHACGNKQIAGNKEYSDSQTKAASAVEAVIPFTLASNYFVRNDYLDSATHLLKLETHEAFDRVFGMAATMNLAGKPTPINFNTHYVLACIGNSSNKNMELQATSLMSGHGNILLTCISKEGSVQSFTSRNALILLVDKQYQGNPQLQLR